MYGGRRLWNLQPMELMLNAAIGKYNWWTSGMDWCTGLVDWTARLTPLLMKSMKCNATVSQLLSNPSWTTYR